MLPLHLHQQKMPLALLNLHYLPRKLHNPSNLHWQIGQLMTMISTTSMARRDDAVDARSERRIERLKRSRRTGMTFTIQVDRTVTKSTRIVTKRSERSEIGKMCYTHTD
jgi:hypothetical protein